MKPVFMSDNLGCLYQSGYRQLERMPLEKRMFFDRDLALALAVSPHVSQMKVPTQHVPFGDNKRWRGPGDELQAAIWLATGALHVGGNVLVYCFYGRNRSGLVAALIIREVLGVTGAEALRLLRRGRRGAVGGNQHFVSYLEGLGTP